MIAATFGFTLLCICIVIIKNVWHHLKHMAAATKSIAVFLLISRLAPRVCNCRQPAGVIDMVSKMQNHRVRLRAARRPLMRPDRNPI